MSWCTPCDALFDTVGMHVLDVWRDERDRLVVTVEIDASLAGCPRCGVAIGHGRRGHTFADTAVFGSPVVVRWRQRVWLGSRGAVR